MERSSALPYRLLGVGVFVVALGLYLKTQASTVSFWDCGEFIACSYILGVPHPPGAPLYVLLGRLFTLIPLHEVAWRVTLMSALASALGIWCVYLSAVALARRALGGVAQTPFGDGRDLSCLCGAGLAALVLATSYTYWFNAVEAEVYGYSIFFACLSLWLILYWEGTQHGAGNDRFLLLIAYLFGLGGGIHLLCLLTIPSLLILAWYADAKLRRLIVVLLGLGVWSGVWLVLLGPGAGSNGALGVGLGGGLYYLYGKDRRSFGLLLGVLVLFGLGYSTYAALYIRSGLNPAIDENDPETLAAFVKFLNREQYGTDSQLLGMLEGQASRVYQFWHLQMKYFFQQFPLSFLEVEAQFRRATGAAYERVWISLVPYALGLWGCMWQARKDGKRFWALLVLFGVMGFGLSLYLNMRDPQPRERHYVFGGMFCAFAVWMGLGWTGLVEAIRSRWRLSGWRVGLVGCVGLLLPVGLGVRQYHVQDRTGDYIAYDYAYNLLHSCDPHSLLFTNGDNDTFPLWFLQEVEGIRRDVRVINLSLLNTGWYIKQLRDREPRVDIRFGDTLIDSALTDTQEVDLRKRLWPEPKVPKDFKELGLDVQIASQPGHGLLRIQDIMVMKIIRWNEWKRPIYFAITVAGSNRLNLDPYLRMEGMTMRLVEEKDLDADGERLEHNLFNVYRFRSIKDPEVYKDGNTTRLLGNYHACVMQLAEIYQREGKTAELVDLMDWASTTLFTEWDNYYIASEYLSEVGQLDRAAQYLEEAGVLLLENHGLEEAANYSNLITIGSILLNRYAAYERAERFYRLLIDRMPERWEIYYELAITLQAMDEIPTALELLARYRAEYGEVPRLVEAEQILMNALQNRQAAPESSAAQP